MPSVNSPNKGYELQATGENQGTWGVILNNNALSIVDLNLGGRLAVIIDSANVDLSSTQAQNLFITLTGTLTGNRDLTFPASNGGFYYIYNNTSGAFNVTVKPLGGSGVVVPQGQTGHVFISPTANAAFFAAPPSTAGVVGVANGGTGASTASTARTNLGLGSIATQNSNSVTITGGSITGITDLAVADGGTGASTALGAVTNTVGALGVTTTSITGNLGRWLVDTSGGSNSWTRITDVAAIRSLLNSIGTTTGNVPFYTGGAWTVATTPWSVANGGTGASTLTGLLQGNGTGAITGGATINNDNWSGTDLAITNGGTGQSTAAAGARALLNGLGTTQGNLLFYDGANWVVLAPPGVGTPSWYYPGSGTLRYLVMNL